MSADAVFITRFSGVTLSAAQDIFSLLASANKAIEIRHIQLSASGVISPAEIPLNLKRLPATVTNGSGGSTPTKQKVDKRTGVSPTATAHANDTTQATTSGTAEILASWNWNVLLPFDYMPGPEASDRESCDVSESLVFELPSTPGAAVTVSGFIKWCEKA